MNSSKISRFQNAPEFDPNLGRLIKKKNIDNNANPFTSIHVGTLNSTRNILTTKMF